MLRGIWAKFISEPQNPRVSSHSMISLNTVRLLFSKMLNKKNLGGCLEVDPVRRELIRHHKDERQYLHEMQRSPAVPIPKEQLLDEREDHVEHQKSGKKVQDERVLEGQNCLQGHGCLRDS